MEEMKMMLVDDEERFLSTTKKLLSKKGYDVFTAISGAEALEKLKDIYLVSNQRLEHRFGINLNLWR